MSSFYSGKLVLVAGGTGLIGSHVVEELLALGARVRIVRHERPSPFPVHAQLETLEGDLRSKSTTDRALSGVDYVFQCTGVSGGMGRMARDPIPMFTDPMILSFQILESARRANVARFAFLSNASVYPQGSEPMTEDRAWGLSIDGVENHAGLAKRISEIQCRLYGDQTDMKIAIVRGGAAYGPRDNFDLANSHVIPALIRKALENRQELSLWGDGGAIRDFTHAADIARGLIFALEHYAVCLPLNVATGRPRSIRHVAEIILQAIGQPNRKIITQDRPSGAPSKLLDISRMKSLGFQTRIPLESGLTDTIRWWLERKRGEPREA